MGELSSAYIRYAHSENLTATLLSSSVGHIVLKIAGTDPWRAFRHEPGKHCCQRIPPTESKGRRHTSMVSVAVLPIRDDIPELDDADVEVTTCGGHGPGGQHQNKTDSAVRMRHTPTGLMVFINGRSQHANRREARRILAARVADMMRDKADAEYSGERRAQIDGGGRGNKVRTYNFMNSRVVDHRLGRRTGQIKRVMRGEFRLLLG